MYSRLPAFVLGFHGCDKSVCDDIVCGRIKCLKNSTNDYDWLGHGIYFWENDLQRALKYAKSLQKSPSLRHNINEPAVLGAVINLGYCLNLMESESLSRLKETYGFLYKKAQQINVELPQNSIGKRGGFDLLVRKLDCFVIQSLHEFMNEAKMEPYDTVRGLFLEGKDLYPNAGFKEKNHIQICVRNPKAL